MNKVDDGIFRMAVVAMFFKLSMSVRDLHNYLVEEKGMPSWASYSLFGGVTLLLGCILGFVSTFHSTKTALHISIFIAENGNDALRHFSMLSYFSLIAFFPGRTY